MHFLRHRILASVGFAILLAGAVPAAEPVSVYLDFDGRPSDVSVEVMKNETNALMQAAGLRIDWRLLKSNTGRERSHRLVVVRFTGKCATGEFLPPQKDENNVVTLGTTAVADGNVLPYSEVECDAVRRFLPENRLSGNRREKDSVLGRAMGRVLAHELYHALLRTTKHGHSGLMRAVHTPRELRSKSVAFMPSDLTALKQ
jgi:hypothetical protein